ncbi:N-6 DNA methylase [Luteibacter sp. NPDC031894]|uniref:N-6 DNA methylase n=1 Tax=Luteibacter sp. NPDC031894 TaxID=3390572 RepID=UPI003D028EE0
MKLTQDALDAFMAEVKTAQADATATETVAALLEAAEAARVTIGKADATQLDSLKTVQATLEGLAPQLKAAGKLLEARHKTWLKLLETAEKGLRARLSKAFEVKALREAKRSLQAADVRKNEEATTRDLVLEGMRQSAHFIAQGRWLLSRFPDGVFAAVPGLCKVVTVEEIAANDYSLTPGRYVGVAAVSEDDEEDFVEKMREIHDELTELNERAVEFAGNISRNFQELFA